MIKTTAKDVVKVFGIEADDNITEEAEEILRFKCDQCDYDSISEKGLRQHMRSSTKTPRWMGLMIQRMKAERKLFL